jgi:mlo protein
MILIVGTKLQLIITCLAYEVRVAAHGDAKGIKICKVREDMKKCPAIRPRDDLFWFSYPRLLLFLLHFILFQVLLLAKILVRFEGYFHTNKSWCYISWFI